MNFMISFVLGKVFIRFVLREVFVGHADMRANVQEFYHLLRYLHVEIEEKLVFLLVERADVILVILKERAFSVSRQERIPMHVAPVGMVGDTNVLHRHRRVVVGRDGERKRTVGRENGHAVAIRLLDKTLLAFDQTFVIAIQLLIPLHRAEISGRK